jgi:protein SCO1/2
MITFNLSRFQSGILFFILLVSTAIMLSCNTSSRALPYLGESEIIDGKTIPYTIPPFTFVNQHGDSISDETVKNKVYITDFFFTHCPTICPKMAQQMLRLHEKYKDREDVLLLSHSIDSKYDTVATLKRYAEKLGVVESNVWHFLHVPADQLTFRAKSYLTAVEKDSTESVGFTHSGHFILVDRERHIRSFCDGTKPEEVNKLMKDIDHLLNEKAN